MQKARDELIAEIRALRDELVGLDVRREYIDFGKLKEVADLTDVRDSIREQLATRKKFLSRNNMEV